MNKKKNTRNKSEKSAELSQLLDLMKKHLEVDSDKVLEFGQKAIKLADKLADKRNLATALKYIGIEYYNKGNYERAIEQLVQAHKIFNELGDKHQQTILLEYIGNCYADTRNYETALQNYMRSLRIAKKTGNPKREASLLNCIGALYVHLGDHDKAFEYLNWSRKIAEEKKLNRLIVKILGNIGLMYIMQKKNKEALRFFIEAAERNKAENNKDTQIGLFVDIGRIYYQMKDYDKALKYVNDGLDIARKVGNTLLMATSLLGIGFIYLECGNYDEAINYLMEALKISEDMKYNLQKSDIHNLLARAYKEKKDYKTALEHMEQYVIIQKKILEDMNSKTLSEIRAKYETELYHLKNVELEKIVSERTAKMRKLLQEIVLTIANVMETRDPYTAGHQERVAKLSVAIAKKMGLDEQRIEGIRTAALLHDIGKIYVPAEILTRPGKLTETQFSIIKEHAKSGYDILKPIDFPWPVADIVRQHHERLDGSGYPDGLSGDEIILEARIIGVADVLEAMSSHRPYRPALGMEKAIEEIESKKGKIYDEDVVKACTEVIEEGFEFK